MFERTTWDPERGNPRLPRRDCFGVATRLFLLSGALLAVVGFIGHAAGWVLVTTTIGPTLYILLAHPDLKASTMRSGVLGHGCAIASGLAMLAAFGLWTHPSVPKAGHDTAAQIGAETLSVAITLFLLTVLDAHHPPAASTALLITSGIARPGPPLYGMIVGLAAVLAVAPLLAGLPGFRAATIRVDK